MKNNLYNNDSNNKYNNKLKYNIIEKIKKQ